MGNNPLQQYFRQPKIFLKLPSLGMYNDPATIQGNVESLPIFGMTGMDQVIVKTPDALISGESTVKVIESCCPSVKDAWKITSIDIDSILVAIRIATYGNNYGIQHTCTECGSQHEYDIDLGRFITHFSNCVYDSKIMIGDLIIRIRPLEYKQATEFNLANFGLQKQLMQLNDLEDAELKKSIISTIFNDLGILQNKIFLAGIESIETPTAQVTEWTFIKEWLENCGSEIADALKLQFEKNTKAWMVPPSTIKCTDCGHTEEVHVELDQSNFFVKA
jgi:hypothetical protein